MARIIGIHGLSNKPAAVDLEAWWKLAILEGLERNRRLVPDIDFTSVYWADVTYPDGPDRNPQRYLRSGDGPLARYRDGWLDRLAATTLDVGGDLLDGVKKLFDVRHTAEAVLERKLPDLHRYYTEASTRATLRDRLAQALLARRAERTMLIAHSMGTIIAYDVLRELGQREPDYRLRHFVTLGSPLGLPHVLHKIKQEHGRPRTPSVVERWSNFADRRDPVAADVFLSGDFEANDRGVEVKDDLVINDYPSNPHKSYGYLRAPEVSDVIRGFV